MITHLRLHSEYSLTHGLIRLGGDREIGKLARDRGIGAVALTDTNNVCGAIKHYRSCVRHGIKPILGCHALFRRNELGFSATLLAMDTKGYRNLSRLLSEAQTQGDGRIDTHGLTPSLTEGVIMLAGFESDVCALLSQGKAELAQDQLETWKGLFPDGRFACEISFGVSESRDNHSLVLAKQAAEASVPCVAAHPVCFPDKKDFDAHEVRTCIANSEKLDDKRRDRPYSNKQYLLSAKEMRTNFSMFPEALENAAEIARRCNFDFHLKNKPQYPRVPGVNQDEVDERIRESAAKNLEKRLGKKASDAYHKRLEDELAVITSKGFSGYFLIVAELVGFAKDNDIPVGPGRGSGAGSLVAYCLGITDVDPIKYDLLFERFLNPERTALPDFDIDFCRDRREEVIDHARKLYGKDCVSQVITFGTLRAKAVVRDVCRVLGMPYGTGDWISRLIPDRLYITLQEARSEVSDLDKALKEDENLERMWEFSLALEGITRQGSTHAAAVLITPEPLVNYCPLIKVGDKNKSHAISQFDKEAVEAIGLIKFDILGLKNLTMIHMAEKMIAREIPGFSLGKIDLDDDKMFEVYRSGGTVGVFQCESPGMVRLIKRIRPRSIGDIAVSISLFRPGALNTKMDEKYLDGRDNQEKIVYPHESVQDILSPTYGAMIYQEQPMRISQDLAGFSLAKADLMRAAIGKKDAKAMAALEEEFIGGSQEKLGRRKSKKLFEEIKEFAGYGFNKSHAICYALISLQTAYLKANHKSVFYASSLATWQDDPKTQAMLLRDARNHGTKVLLPDINKSDALFSPVSGTSLRYGLGSVRGVGSACAEQIVGSRKAKGDYKNMDDLCIRSCNLNRYGLENLVSSGALDMLAGQEDPCAGRALLYEDIAGALESASIAASNANQDSLFEGNGAPARTLVSAAKPWSKHSLLIRELMSLGATISGRFTDALAHFGKLFRKVKEVEGCQDNESGKWVGEVSKVITNTRIRKQGREVFELDDGFVCEVVADASILKEKGISLADPGLVLVVSGDVKRTPGFRARISANSIENFDSWLERHLETVSIDVANSSSDDFDWLLWMLGENDKKGWSNVEIKLGGKKGNVTIDTGKRHAIDLEAFGSIHNRFGDKSVEVFTRRLA